MAVTTEQPDTSQQLQSLAALWWIPLVRGIVLIIFGLLMFARPGATLVSLIIFLGAYWLVGGIFDLIEGLMGHTDRSRVWLIISAIISIIAGFIVMQQPVMAGVFTSTFLIYFIAIASIIAGVMQIFAGNEGSWSWGGFFLGILYIIFGVIILANPLLTTATVVLLLPYWALVTGIFSIVAAFMLRGAKNSV